MHLIIGSLDLQACPPFQLSHTMVKFVNELDILPENHEKLQKNFLSRIFQPLRENLPWISGANRF